MTDDSDAIRNGHGAQGRKPAAQKGDCAEVYHRDRCSHRGEAQESKSFLLTQQSHHRCCASSIAEQITLCNCWSYQKCPRSTQRKRLARARFDPAFCQKSEISGRDQIAVSVLVAPFLRPKLKRDAGQVFAQLIQRESVSFQNLRWLFLFSPSQLQTVRPKFHQSQEYWICLHAFLSSAIYLLFD